MSKPENPGGAEYPTPGVLLRYLERHPCGPDYVRRNAELIRTKYPGSWPAMRPEFTRLYRAELAKTKNR